MLHFLRSAGRSQNTIHSLARTRSCDAGIHSWKKSCAKPNSLSRSKKSCLCCWAGHCHRCRTARTPDGRSGRTQLAGRRAACLSGSFCSALWCVSPSSASPFSAACACSSIVVAAFEGRGEVNRSGVSARRTLSGLLTRASLCLASGPRPVPLFDPYDVSAFGCGGRKSRTPRSTHPSALPQARTAGNRTKPTLELGYHQAQGTGEMELLLSVRHPRRVQPLRHRLDDCLPRDRRPGQTIDRALLSKAEDHAWSTNYSCGSRFVHDLEVPGPIAGRSRCRQNPQPPACFR